MSETEYTYLPTRAQYDKLTDEHELALLAASELDDGRRALVDELTNMQQRLALYEVTAHCGHPMCFSHVTDGGETVCLRCAYHTHDLDS